MSLVLSFISNVTRIKFISNVTISIVIISIVSVSIVIMSIVITCFVIISIVITYFVITCFVIISIVIINIVIVSLNPQTSAIYVIPDCDPIISVLTLTDFNLQPFVFNQNQLIRKSNQSQAKHVNPFFNYFE